MSNEEEEERGMNDTTLPQSIGTTNGKTTTTTVVVPTTIRRKKTGRFGLSDWNRMVALSKDLALRKGRPLRKIRWMEIQQHNTLHDGWMVLKGKVYYISPYLAYHPGGESILRGSLGKDGTRLFEKYHRWVNEDGLIGKLLLGYLDTSTTSDEDVLDDEKPSYLPQQMTSDGFAIPTPRTKKG